uniref:Uncharacterized protein n=1 Tax=Anguilla anguilla TaxID=7936 RepID=A0A0E9U2H0_ANGAN
MTEETQQRR